MNECVCALFVCTRVHVCAVVYTQDIRILVIIPIGTTGRSLPFIMVGDEAFPLKEYLLRPYPGRFLPDKKAIYNYRLSRARRVVENTFGTLASRFVCNFLLSCNDYLFLALDGGYFVNQ